MNHFGRLFQISIYGESHGNSVGVILDGVKPGIPLSSADFTADLLRRKSGGKGTTPRIETDEIIIESGVFNGYTTGAPILLRFLNQNTKLETLIFIKDTGYLVYDELKKLVCNKRLLKVEDMREAVNSAYLYTKKGSSCVLSPAAASYNTYKNFEERGNDYKQEVKNQAK